MGSSPARTEIGVTCFGQQANTELGMSFGEICVCVYVCILGCTAVQLGGFAAIMEHKLFFFFPSKHTKKHNT